MPGRISQLATNPMLTNYAIAASQAAVLARKIGNFVAPVCEVPDVVFHYKKYTNKNRYRVPNTKRAPGQRATVIGADASDSTLVLQPNALDFPIPDPTGKGIGGMNDKLLTYWIKTGQTTLADVSALAQESDQIKSAVAAGADSLVNIDYSQNVDPIGDPILGLDAIILEVMKGSLNSGEVKVLFGMTAFRKFRNNVNVKNKFVVAGNRSNANGAVGTVSPSIADVGGLLINNPKVELAGTVIDTSPQGLAPAIQFLLDDKVLVFASNDQPNLMDASFMKTFALMDGFFKPGAYQSEDERDQILKMDWISKPEVTNSAAVIMVNTTTGAEQSETLPALVPTVE